MGVLSTEIAYKTKSNHATLGELPFADDFALTTWSEAEMQSSVSRFASACDNSGLTISAKKIEFLYQPSPTFLQATIYDIANASAAFGRLRDS